MWQISTMKAAMNRIPVREGNLDNDVLGAAGPAGAAMVPPWFVSCPNDQAPSRTRHAPNMDQPARVKLAAAQMARSAIASPVKGP